MPKNLDNHEAAQMNKPIDDSLDQVMVIVENEPTLNNRLALLDEIGKLFRRISDLPKLS